MELNTQNKEKISSYIRSICKNASGLAAKSIKEDARKILMLCGCEDVFDVSEIPLHRDGQVRIRFSADRGSELMYSLYASIQENHNVWIGLCIEYDSTDRFEVFHGEHEEGTFLFQCEF